MPHQLFKHQKCITHDIPIVTPQQIEKLHSKSKGLRTLFFHTSKFFRSRVLCAFILRVHYGAYFKFLSGYKFNFQTEHKIETWLFQKSAFSLHLNHKRHRRYQIFSENQITTTVNPKYQSVCPLSLSSSTTTVMKF